MSCAWCREALSAFVDGEERPGERAEIDGHLAWCSECRHYAAGVAEVAGLLRVDSAVAATAFVGPSGVDAMAGTLTKRSRRAGVKRHTALRLLLVVLGLGQLGLAATELVRSQQNEHGPMSFSGASLAQLAHESCAWNLALAVGFFWVAIRPNRTRALIPLVSVFVAGLTVFAAMDAMQGRFLADRLWPYSIVVLGLVVLVALSSQLRQLARAGMWEIAPR
ncbi:MAG TPA: zf-HC2 domain-containing protein [Pseudonocardia sp.]|jgi:predicted anti-sigma-YlaC factor YlaD|nr:zf-HC2 domain-containing protein [Pseudonocardia sp.]